MSSVLWRDCTHERLWAIELCAYLFDGRRAQRLGDEGRRRVGARTADGRGSSGWTLASSSPGAQTDWRSAPSTMQVRSRRLGDFQVPSGKSQTPTTAQSLQGASSDRIFRYHTQPRLSCVSCCTFAAEKTSGGAWAPAGYYTAASPPLTPAAEIDRPTACKAPERS